MLLRVEFDALTVEVPSELQTKGDDSLLKEWLWEHHQEQIKAGMSLQSPKETTTSMRLRLLDTISSVQRKFFLKESSKVVFGCLLDALLDLMDSEYGFIGEICHEDDGTMYLQTHAVTNIAWNAATRKFYEDNIDDGLKFYNLNTLFGRVMTSKAPVISNQPKSDKRAGGIPEGHPPLDRFLGIPLFDQNGNMNGMVGIANKPEGYSQQDIDFLEPFTTVCSNLIQAYFQIKENEILINTLEDKVQERTQTLKLTNERLEQANVQIRKSSQAQLQHFAAASHELRTPLNGIIGLSSILEDTELNPMQKESVRMIVNSGELLLTVVGDVLDYSKLETGNVDIEMRKSNLQETLQSVVHSMESKAQTKGIVIQTNYDMWLPEHMTTDSRRLQQVLFNVMGNAIKFSRENENIELSVSLQDNHHAMLTDEKEPAQEESKVDSDFDDSASRCPFSRSSASSSCPFSRSSETLSKDTANDKQPSAICFKVKDYGRGIAKEDQERIFEPFQQANSDTERFWGGTGLGLAITSKLVKALGGSISVDSELGKWTEFTILLPLMEAAAKPLDSANNEMMVVLVSNEDCSEASRVSAILEAYSIKWTKYNSLDGALSTSLRQRSTECSILFLTHEDLYSQEPRDRIKQSFPLSTTVTFGPNYSASSGDLHFKSLCQMLPCVLVKALADTAQEVRRQVLVPSSPEPVSKKKSLSVAGLRVLVAEDNMINQKVIVHMLRRLGVEKIGVAANGQEAVEMEAADQYELCLMDWQMPVLDGLGACDRISQRESARPKPKIVFVTAQVSSEFEAKCRQKGAVDFLPKPFNIKAIETCLRNLFSPTVSAASDGGMSLLDNASSIVGGRISRNKSIDISELARLDISSSDEFSPIVRRNKPVYDGLDKDPVKDLRHVSVLPVARSSSVGEMQG